MMWLSLLKSLIRSLCVNWAETCDPFLPCICTWFAPAWQSVPLLKDNFVCSCNLSIFLSPPHEECDALCSAPHHERFAKHRPGIGALHYVQVTEARRGLEGTPKGLDLDLALVLPKARKSYLINIFSISKVLSINVLSNSWLFPRHFCERNFFDFPAVYSVFPVPYN